jgi:hypothetical protein
MRVRWGIWARWYSWRRIWKGVTDAGKGRSFFNPAVWKRALRRVPWPTARLRTPKNLNFLRIGKNSTKLGNVLQTEPMITNINFISSFYLAVGGQIWHLAFRLRWAVNLTESSRAQTPAGANSGCWDQECSVTESPLCFILGDAGEI